MIQLRAHQQKAVEAARTKPNLGLFFDPGTGKTGTMIRILAEDYNGQKRICNTLIFAPLTVCPQWKMEFERFSRVDPERILVLTQSGKKRAEILRKQKQPVIVVTNYEGVQIKEFYDALLAWSPEITVFDESHRIKDSQGKRAKAIYPLAHSSRRRFLLTGTPVVNSLLDIFGQFKALSPTTFGGGFWGFKNKFFYDRNSGKQFAYPDWVPHPWAAQQIGRAMAEVSLQAKREECLDLPPLSQIPVPVEMSGQQTKAYLEMKKDFLTEVNGMIASSEFEMVKTLRMQQILAGFIQPDETKEALWFSDQPRLDTLLDIIDSIGKEKCIVWTTFKPTYRKIGNALEKAKIKYVYITGEQTLAEKRASVEAFRTGDAQIVIANPAAASEGIDGLQIAKYAIYYLRGYNLLHFLQSLARNYRSGSEEFHDKVVHYHLYAKGTLDEVIAKALLNKEDIGRAVLRWAQGEDFTLDMERVKP